jgi:hypothetical protein
MKPFELSPFTHSNFSTLLQLHKSTCDSQNSLMFVPCFSLISVLRIFFSNEQFPTIWGALEQMPQAIEFHRYSAWQYPDGTIKPVSKELVQQFVKLLSSKSADRYISLICQCFNTYLTNGQDEVHQLFSAWLNRSLLRIMSCGTGGEVLPVIDLYATITRELLVEQKRAAANSGAWSVVIRLLNCQNDEVVRLTTFIMLNLVDNRSGEDYARFIEAGLFERAAALLGRYPSQLSEVLINIVGPFPLPEGCTPLVIMLTDHALSRDKRDSIGAFKMLTSLAHSRGLDRLLFIRFTEICSFTPVLVQETTNCY